MKSPNFSKITSKPATLLDVQRVVDNTIKSRTIFIEPSFTLGQEPYFLFEIPENRYFYVVDALLQQYDGTTDYDFADDSKWYIGTNDTLFFLNNLDKAEEPGRVWPTSTSSFFKFLSSGSGEKTPVSNKLYLSQSSDTPSTATEGDRKIALTIFYYEIPKLS